MASFSAFGGDFLSIALIVFHCLEGSVLLSGVSTNCLHFFPMIVCCSGDHVVHLLQGGRGGISGSEVTRVLILSNISTGTGSVLIRCRQEGICYVVMLLQNDGTQDIFSFLAVLLEAVFAHFISLQYRSQFAFLELKLVRWGIGYICKQIRIGRWSEPRFVCQLVEVIREADANETSEEDGLA